MSIEHFAARSFSLAEHLALVCAHNLPGNIETLDEFVGRALVPFSLEGVQTFQPICRLNFRICVPTRPVYVGALVAEQSGRT